MGPPDQAGAWRAPDPLPDGPTRGLSKSLTRLDLLVIGVAQIIGAGIFIISGVGIKIAGPGISCSFLVAGPACSLAALCYAELASMMPHAGSAYTYAYGIFGESGRLDRRLGPDPGIRHGRRHRGRGLVFLSPGPAALLRPGACPPGPPARP